MPGQNPFPKKSLLIGVIGDETTVTGFLLTGIGERARDGVQNFMIVTKETSTQELEQGFQKMIDRSDVGIILISQSLAERCRNMIDEHQGDEEKVLPTILEIPSKDAPYDPTKDGMLV